LTLQQQDTLEFLPVPEDKEPTGELSTKWLESFEEELGVQLSQGMARKLWREKQAIKRKIKAMIGATSKVSNKALDASSIGEGDIDFGIDEQSQEIDEQNEDKEAEGDGSDPNDPETKEMRETKFKLEHAM